MTKNELSDLIPGYSAPMELKSRKRSSLPSLAEMRQQSLVSEARAKKTMPTSAETVSFKTGRISRAAKQRIKSASAGSQWFGMRPTPMDDDMKRDVQILENRSYLDPKRFYKKSSEDMKGKVLQRGTVIEGTGEFYSARLSKKQRRNNLTDEIMSDQKIRDYTKSQFTKIQSAKQEKARKRRMRR